MERSPSRVDVDSTSYILDDFFKIEEAWLRFERYDGTMSEPIRRLNFERGDAVAVVLYDRDERDVVLVEQFRYPTLAKGDGWVVELVAGIVEGNQDLDETALRKLREDTARREVLEEAGYRVGEVEEIGGFFLSPGGSSERIFLYHAEVGTADHVEAGGGISTEGEDIRLVRKSLAEVTEDLANRRIVDAKTVIGLTWLLGKLGGD